MIENGVEFRKSALTELVRDSKRIFASSWQVDGHMHTNWTDGADDVPTMLQAARQAGLMSVLFSEHSSMKSADWFGNFVNQVRAAPSDSTRTYVGTECRIAGLDGSLALLPEIRDLCDVVVASVHRFPSPSGTPLNFSQTDVNEVLDLELVMMVNALRREEADILGHPFGMSIQRFGIEPTDEHWMALVSAASESAMALEINSKYHRIPQVVEVFTWRECRVSLGSDAHDSARVGEAARLLRGGFK